MAVYLELARAILEKRSEDANRPPDVTSFLLNEKQCVHLWRFIRLVYNYLSSSQLPDNKRHKYLPNIFKEFYILVTRANAIVQVFSSEQSWLQAVILQGNHRLAFKELNLDLKACVRLFHESTGHHIPSDAHAIIWRQDDWDAVMDSADLRYKLKDLLARPALGEEERLLARFILQRENSTRLRCSGLDDYIPELYPVKSESLAYERGIGRGSYGAISLVKWLGMICAKKHFHDPKEYITEVKVLAKLNHPHIVKLLCVSEQPELFYVMEMMPMSLSDFIEERWSGNPDGITPTAAVDIMVQIARGIDYLHKQGIAHRDLKSSNILISPSEVEHLRQEGYVYVKLIDFGLAKMEAHDLMNPTREMMGTTRWRAPEAFGKDQPINWKKADAYSFAMMCSEVLTGRIPFVSRPLCELYTRIISGERPELPSSCPEALASLLKLCWDSDPTVRPCFTQISETLISVRDDLLKFRWDGCGRTPVDQLSKPGFRILKKAVVSPDELQSLHAVNRLGVVSKERKVQT